MLTCNCMKLDKLLKSRSNRSRSNSFDDSDLNELNTLRQNSSTILDESRESKRRSKLIEKELKRSGKVYKATIKLLLLGTGESGKSTVLKQMRIIHTSRFTDEEKRSKINDIKSNIRDSILSILGAMERFNIQLESSDLLEKREFVFENTNLIFIHDKLDDHDDDHVNQDDSRQIKINKLWDYIEELWNDSGVKRCAKYGNEYHLIDSAQYFLDRIKTIRKASYLPDDQDILRCRVLTTGIKETRFNVKNVNFHVFDVGGQRDQRRKWIQCFNQVTAIIFVADISSFNMTLRENHKVNRLKESLQSFRQIWINRYLYHISIILFLNKYDIFVKKIVEENCKLEDYFPDYKNYNKPNRMDKHLITENEDPEVTRAKMFILEQFIKITNERLSESLFKIDEYDSCDNDNNISYRNMDASASINIVEKPIIKNSASNDSYTFANSNEDEKVKLIKSTSNYNNSTCNNNNNNNNSLSDNNYRDNYNCSNGSSFTRTSNGYQRTLQQIGRSYREAEEESINGKFCIPYFTCAVDTENIKRVFKACGHILKKEHLEKCGLV